MELVVIPTLKDVASQSIAVCMWSEADIKELVLQNHTLRSYDTYIPERDCPLKEIEDKIMIRVFQLPLLEHLKGNLQAFVRSVGRQILAWMDFHYYLYNQNPPRKFFWTARGTIDQRSTAENLGLDNDVKLSMRCAITQIHCARNFGKLKKEMEDIHNGVSEGYKSLVYYREFYLTKFKALISEDGEDLEFFSSRNKPENGFCYSAFAGNEEATKYYLERLDTNERKETLERTACFMIRNYERLLVIQTEFCSIYYANVMHLILSALGNEQRMLFIRNYAPDMLNFFADWPWRQFFEEILKCRSAYFEMDDFNHVLLELADSRRNSRDIGPFFRQVWYKMPQPIMEQILMEKSDIVYSLAYRFLEKEENSKMILNDVLALIGQEFIFSDAGKSIRKMYIHFSEFEDVFERFIQRCFTTKESMITFHDELVNQVATVRNQPSDDVLAPTASNYDKAIEIMDQYLRTFEDENGEAGIEEAMDDN